MLARMGLNFWQNEEKWSMEWLGLEDTTCFTAKFFQVLVREILIKRLQGSLTGTLQKTLSVDLALLEHELTPALDLALSINPQPIIAVHAVSKALDAQLGALVVMLNVMAQLSATTVV